MSDDARKLNALIKLGIRRQTSVDEQTYQVYVEDLAAIAADVVERACDAIGRQPREEFAPAFPTIGAILDACATAQRETEVVRLRQLAAPAGAFTAKREPTYACPVCLDEPAGWVVFTCRGVGDGRDLERAPHHATEARSCGRMKDHAPHTFSERCNCYATNPVIAQARERMEAARLKREQRPRR